MRGGYTFTRDQVTVAATEDLLGFIVPANTFVDLVDLQLWGKSVAGSAFAAGLFRFTGNTPTLSQAITPKAVDPNNPLAATLSVGGRGTGAQAVWSATPTGLDTEPVLSWGGNLFGGVFPWKADNFRRRIVGGASAMYLTLRTINVGSGGLIGYHCEFLE